MKIQLSDFALNSKVFINYSREQNLSINDFNYDEFLGFLKSNDFNFHNPSNYCLGLFDPIESCIQNKHISNTFFIKTLIHLNQELYLSLDKTCESSINMCFLPFFKDPMKYYQDDGFYYTMSDIHKQIMILDSCGLVADHSPLRNILAKLNLILPTPLITKEDKKEFINILKAV